MSMKHRMYFLQTVMIGMVWVYVSAADPVQVDLETVKGYAQKIKDEYRGERYTEEQKSAAMAEYEAFIKKQDELKAKEDSALTQDERSLKTELEKAISVVKFVMADQAWLLNDTVDNRALRDSATEAIAKNAPDLVNDSAYIKKAVADLTAQLESARTVADASSTGSATPLGTIADVQDVVRSTNIQSGNFYQNIADSLNRLQNRYQNSSDSTEAENKTMLDSILQDVETVDEILNSALKPLELTKDSAAFQSPEAKAVLNDALSTITTKLEAHGIQALQVIQIGLQLVVDRVSAFFKDLKAKFTKDPISVTPDIVTDLNDVTRFSELRKQADKRINQIVTSIQSVADWKTYPSDQLQKVAKERLNQLVIDLEVLRVIRDQLSEGTSKIGLALSVLYDMREELRVNPERDINGGLMLFNLNQQELIILEYKGQYIQYSEKLQNLTEKMTNWKAALEMMSSSGVVPGNFDILFPG
jgi:hypothetical protein